MTITPFIVLLLVVLGFLALKFFEGMVKIVAALAFFLLAAGLLIFFLTGTDLLGFESTVGAALQGVNSTIKEITGLAP